MKTGNVAKRISASLLSVVMMAVTLFPGISVSAEESGYSVESSGDDIEFAIEVEDCENGRDNGRITCTILNADEDDTYSVSFNAGAKYRAISGNSFKLKNVKSGSYQICVKKNNDKKKVSALYTVHVGDEEDGYSADIYTRSIGEELYKDGSVRIEIVDYSSAKDYEYTINGGKSWRAMSGEYISVVGLKSGNIKVAVREKNKPSKCSAFLTVKIPEVKTKKSHYINTDVVLQLPELPTGCEVTSLTMLLNHLGFKADKEVIADKYLPKGTYRASDFMEVFVGDPRSTYAYGCYSKVIVKTAEKYLKKYDKKGKYLVRSLTGCTAENLYASIDDGNPVVVWATLEMEKPEKGISWEVKDTGKTVTWTSGEHCLLMTGYDKEKNIVYMNDPMVGRKTYDMALFEKRFRQMGSHAVIITKK